jgi:phosphoadenosine phosphosulfate reductase
VTVDEPVADIRARLQGLTAEQVLAEAATRYAGRIAFATTLGAEDQVVTHMIAEAGLGIPIFTVDTGRLLPETHDLIERASERYGLRIAVYSPNGADVEQLVKRGGINLFRNSAFERDLCCEARKTKPLRRAQVGLDVWIRVSHGDQGAVGKNREIVAWDPSVGLVRVDPLAAWDDKMVWDYVHAHDVPYNPLQDQGFETIDCAPCARRTVTDQTRRSISTQTSEETR